ncbi:hypothetical protein Pelo_18022 [Pelomyxa schiedti]|nr:hypothetical protein Pelo_18022 [Pelomyxa schiedti]
MAQWCRSPSLFRSWAEDWVLRPERSAVFQLPFRRPFLDYERERRRESERRPEDCGSGHCFLCVSVSPTLGIVGHPSWFTCFGTKEVCGSPGQATVLVASVNLQSWGAECRVVNCGRVGWALDHDAISTSRKLWSGDMRDCGSEFTSRWRCNGKWIVLFFPEQQEARLWKVVGGEPQRPEVRLRVCVDGGRNDTGSQLGSTAILIDLEATFRAQKLVVMSQIARNEPSVCSVMWMPDGSLCTLHQLSSSPFLIVEGTTTKGPYFPPSSNVTPVGKRHATVASRDTITEFRVYQTGTTLDEPTLCVPCTWACASSSTGLIVSTAHHIDDEVSDNHANEVRFKVHDGVSGFCVGEFVVNPPRFLFDSGAYKHANP